MKFKMNNVEYIIKEVSQDYLNSEKIDEEDGYYYGKTYFMTRYKFRKKKKNTYSRTYTRLY